MNITPENTIDIGLFSEIIDGKLKPTNKEFNNPKNLSNLIKKSQTLVFSFKPDNENAFNDDQKPDLRRFGFKSMDDYLVKKRFDPLLKKDQFEVQPLKVYKSLECFEVPQYASLKLNTFVALILDEYERIKIRAEHKHDLVMCENELNFYCKKNLQKARKLYNDTLKCLKSSNCESNLEDFFIIFILSQMLIKTIQFFQKQFYHFIDFEIEDEQTLYSQLYSKAFNGKLDLIFKLALVKLNDTEAETGSNNGLQEVSAQFRDQKTSRIPANYIQPKEEMIIWKGQINVLVDGFEQISDAQDADGTRLCIVSQDRLQKLICNNFCDSNGVPIKPNTVRTILSPSRIDKKINKDSEKRLNLPFNSK